MLFVQPTTVGTPRVKMPISPIPYFYAVTVQVRKLTRYAVNPVNHHFCDLTIAQIAVRCIYQTA